MYCTNCGTPIDPNAVACMKCGFHPRSQNNFCGNCGNNVNPNAVVCTNCGVPLRGAAPGGPAGNAEQKDWLTTLLLCIFLGGIGIHRFYTGHTTIGVIQLLTLGGCGIWALIDLISIISGSYTDFNGMPLRKN